MKGWMDSEWLGLLIPILWQSRNRESPSYWKARSGINYRTRFWTHFWACRMLGKYSQEGKKITRSWNPKGILTWGDAHAGQHQGSHLQVRGAEIKSGTLAKVRGGPGQQYVSASGQTQALSGRRRSQWRPPWYPKIMLNKMWTHNQKLPNAQGYKLPQFRFLRTTNAISK